MLLTSGQVTMTISSCVGKLRATKQNTQPPTPPPKLTNPIVFIFTSLLFLSGYVLQQQTVRSLQAALHPPLPPSSNRTSTTHARPFGHPPGSPGHASYQAYLGEPTTPIDWTKTAYVQLVRDNTHVCNAAMTFAELARQKSPAQRVLLYPRQWDLDDEAGRGDQRLETSMRLLRVAAVRYQVVLSPVDPILETEAPETAYPLSGLLSLTAFEHILYLRPSGLILDASALDAVFALRTNASLTAFSASTDALPPVTLLTPSSDSFDAAIAALRSDPRSEPSHLLKNTQFLPPPSPLPPLSSQTSSLRLADPSFDSESFLSEIGYVQLDDPEILGPDYDIPREVFLQSRPGGLEARRAWEEVYERYRMQRMDVCGLDLEPMPIFEGGGVEVGVVSEGESVGAGEDGVSGARVGAEEKVGL